MIHHVAIFFDSYSRKLYAAPGKTIAARGDMLVLHAVNTEVRLTVVGRKWFGEKLARSIRKGKKASVRIPKNKGLAPAGVYAFKAYSPQYDLYAIGGSYPKVIIYD